MLRKSARFPRNNRCYCGSGKKHKYCCQLRAAEQPTFVAQKTTYIDSGEAPARYVITDSRGTSFFSDKTGAILVFSSKADAFAIATDSVFAAAEPGEINVAGVGASKWAAIQKDLPFVEPVDVAHARKLVYDRMDHKLAELEAERADASQDE